MEVKNIQVVKLMMVKDKTIPYYARKIGFPRDIAEIGFELLKGADREYFAVICLSRCSGINAVNIVSQGSASYTVIHPREVFKPAILSNANSICLLHNHTSGAVIPSSQDIVVTKSLVDAGILLRIQVLDHVIISDENFYSIKQDYDKQIFKELILD